MKNKIFDEIYGRLILTTETLRAMEFFMLGQGYSEIVARIDRIVSSNDEFLDCVEKELNQEN